MVPSVTWAKNKIAAAEISLMGSPDQNAGRWRIARRGGHFPHPADAGFAEIVPPDRGPCRGIACPSRGRRRRRILPAGLAVRALGGEEDAVGDEGLILRECGGGLGDKRGELGGRFNDE